MPLVLTPTTLDADVQSIPGPDTLLPMLLLTLTPPIPEPVPVEAPSLLETTRPKSAVPPHSEAVH